MKKIELGKGTAKPSISTDSVPTIELEMNPDVPDTTELPEGYPPPILRAQMRAPQVSRKLEIT